MAKEYSIDIIGQPYFEESNDRSFTVYFSEPENGVTEETGLCLLIAGFGGNAESNVYKKMRLEFADKKNYVVIQCNYFGWEFMGFQESEQINKLMILENFFDSQEISYINAGQMELIGDIVRVKEFNMEESREYFCEMGLFQAIDNLRAIKVIQDILESNNLNYNKRKIIAYGFSHGAYLAYLCNAMNPELFSGIIDNSAWLFPRYLTEIRKISGRLTHEEREDLYCEMVGHIKYLATNWIDDIEIYKLEKIYSQINNKARILSFHGARDNLVFLEDKQRFLMIIENAMLFSVYDENVDDEIFKKSGHGLGADFLKLFYHAEDKLVERNEEPEELWKCHTLCSEKYIYCVDLVDGVPEVSRKKKES